MTTTASILPSFANGLDRTLRGLGLAIWLVLAAMPSMAAEGAVRHAEIQSSEEGYVVNADFDLALTNRLEEALRRGVSLYFVAELEITRHRWYWLDEDVVRQRLDYRLSYQAITRAYRLSIGSLHQNFDSLAAAFQTMLRIRNWNVAERGELRPGETYDAALKMVLDTTQLPKPFQVTAFSSRDWNLGTDWYRWTFVAAPPEAR
ncbi:MAG: DUF4390 domain-containing protein [Zoogloeaceae bacterium]|nr:DUF4390 domain-containing protein [Zoogloeaceae bacterium]